MLAKPKQIYEALDALSGDNCHNGVKCDKCKIIDSLLDEPSFQIVWEQATLSFLKDGPDSAFALLLACGIQVGAALRDTELLDSIYDDTNPNKK